MIIVPRHNIGQADTDAAEHHEKHSVELLPLKNCTIDYLLHYRHQEGVNRPNSLRDTDIKMCHLRYFETKHDGEEDARLENCSDEANEERPPVKAVVPFTQ